MLEKDESLQESGQRTEEKAEKPEHFDKKERDCIQQDFSVVHSLDFLSLKNNQLTQAIPQNK